MTMSIRHTLGMAAIAVTAAVSTLDCYTPPKCADPNESWWDCMLTWTSKRTGGVQKAKSWICAPDSDKVGMSTAAMAAAQQAVNIAVDQGLACSMPETAINPKIKCIDSHQNIQPAKPLQGIDAEIEIEKKPERWGDPECDDCMNASCKASLFDCAQKAFCACLNNCFRGQNTFDTCQSGCVGFQKSDLDFELFNAMAQCAAEQCSSVCSNSSQPTGSPNDDENLSCCKNIGCKPG